MREGTKPGAWSGVEHPGRRRFLYYMQCEATQTDAFAYSDLFGGSGPNLYHILNHTCNCWGQKTTMPRTFMTYIEDTMATINVNKDLDFMAKTVN